MQVKVCGMNNIENLNAISALKPNYFGFIFYPKSPRHFNLKTLPEFSKIKKVGVFVDEVFDFILEKQRAFNFKCIQLHGCESTDYIKNLKINLPSDTEIFKAISVSQATDFNSLERYNGLAEKLILDTKTPLKGGSGVQFNWELLKHYKSEVPFLLSGGISLNDAEKIAKIYHKHPKMTGVDINSKFEIKPGLKSVEQIKNFMLKLNKII